MVSVKRIHSRFVAVFLLAILPTLACTVTFRRKPIEPIDNDRNYDVEVVTCWEASRQVMTAFATGIESESFEADNDAGMLITDYAVFADTGDEDWRHLRRVSYSQGAPFIGGRYQLTLTTRQIRGGACKVRVVARIEGYMGEEYGYQALRSNGTLEQEIFNRISTQLGIEPAGNQPQR